MAMVANKFPGIRATVCWTPGTAEMARKHNNSNCLTLGGRVLDDRHRPGDRPDLARNAV